jgi:hypothetical protein
MDNFNNPSTDPISLKNLSVNHRDLRMNSSFLFQEQKKGAPLHADSQFATVAEAPPPDLSEVTMRETLYPHTQAQNIGEGVITISKSATPSASREKSSWMACDAPDASSDMVDRTLSHENR